MYTMYQERTIEFQRFVQDVMSNRLCVSHYFDEKDYMYKYRSIHFFNAQYTLYQQMRQFLHKYCPGKYLVMFQSSIVVMAVEEAKRQAFSEHSINVNLVK